MGLNFKKNIFFISLIFCSQTYSGEKTSDNEKFPLKSFAMDFANKSISYIPTFLYAGYFANVIYQKGGIRRCPKPLFAAGLIGTFLAKKCNDHFYLPGGTWKDRSILYSMYDYRKLMQERKANKKQIESEFLKD